MRTCNRIQTTGSASYNKVYKPPSRVPASGNFSSHSHSAKSEHVVFFFMCSSTCSKCWKQAILLARLNDQFADIKISLILVGDGRYKKPAKRLIEELNLPIRYMSDNGALRRYYHIDLPDGSGCRWALLFVDPHGIVRFCRAGRLVHARTTLGLRDYAGFLSSMDVNVRKNPEHVMRQKEANSCGRVVKLVPQ